MKGPVPASRGRCGPLAQLAEQLTLINQLLMSTAQAAGSKDEALRDYRRAYNVLAAYEKRDPYAYDTQIRLALTISEMVSRGETDVLPVLAERLAKIGGLLPPYPSVMSFVGHGMALTAHGMALAGDYDGALKIADRTLALNPSTFPPAQTWWARGVALAGLGRFDEAIASLRKAMEFEPGGTFGIYAQRSLARLLDNLGRAAEADAVRKAF